MKAYEIRNVHTNLGGIVYSEINAAARREGAKMYGNGDWFSVTCKRANWADDHKPTQKELAKRGLIKVSLFKRIFGF